jgi:hypothetical protein
MIARDLANLSAATVVLLIACALVMLALDAYIR